MSPGNAPRATIRRWCAPMLTVASAESTANFAVNPEREQANLPLERAGITQRRRLDERPEIAEQGGDKLGDGGVDVHRVRDDRVRGARVHDLEQAVNRFVGFDAEQ